MNPSIDSDDFDLTVIIPAYNEQDRLPRLLSQLWRQRHVHLQIVVVDGGSRDNSASLLQSETEQHPEQFIGCCTRAHRAKQLNTGASLAGADYVLFLHADTDLGDQPELLANALLTLKRERENGECAGHFPLLFSETENQHRFGFYYYAAKTMLNRLDVINGDQGFLLSRELFMHYQGFDESLPYMEDARLANAIVRHQRWITLPGRVHSSARRFLSEGFKKRQLLNSFLCNFNSIGLVDFFNAAADAYKRQNDSQQLDMLPFLRIIHRTMLASGWRQAIRYWYLTGRYIVHNAWQIAFQFDCRRDYRAQCDAHQVTPRHLSRFDRWIAPWMLSAPFYALCAGLTFCWFYSLFLVYRR